MHETQKIKKNNRMGSKTINSPTESKKILKGKNKLNENETKQKNEK